VWEHGYVVVGSGRGNGNLVTRELALHVST
jgi:hypothetical protein